MTRQTAPRPGPAGTETAVRPPAPRQPSVLVARRILQANLVAQIVIVVTGGVVRLTGSGLGCSAWPECEPGQFTPVVQEAVSWHPVIEFGNRTLSGVLLVLALLTAWVVWRQVERATSYRLLGVVPLGLVLVQAVLGGTLVRLGLPPALVGLHFLISMLLVASSTALVIRHGEGDGRQEVLVGPAAQLLGRALVGLCAVVLALGVVVTGSGPHSGDDEVGYRLALDPAEMAKVHAAAVWLYLAAVVALLVLVSRSAARVGSDGRPVVRATRVLLAVTLAQGLVGYVQFFTGLPQALVAAHMLGACLLVVAQVRQLLSMRRRRPALLATEVV